MGELTFSNQLIDTFCEIKCARCVQVDAHILELLVDKAEDCVAF